LCSTSHGSKSCFYPILIMSASSLFFVFIIVLIRRLLSICFIRERGTPLDYFTTYDKLPLVLQASGDSSPWALRGRVFTVEWLILLFLAENNSLCTMRPAVISMFLPDLSWLAGLCASVLHLSGLPKLPSVLLSD
jgi:hypothetical protein